MSHAVRTDTYVESGSGDQQLPTQKEEQLFANTVGACPEVLVNIAGVETLCLVTTVTESYFTQQLRAKVEALQSASWIKLRAANGI